MSLSRNKLIYLNSIVVIMTTIVNVALGMIEVKCFIEEFGSTINGLFQTGKQIMNYMTVLETIIGSAYIFHMYKPLANKEYKKLSAIFNGFRINMYSSVTKMLILACFIAGVYPLIIKRESMSYLFVASVFILISAKTLLPYYITIIPKKMIILKEHKFIAELISGLTLSVNYVVEILLIVNFQLDIRVLLIVSIIISLSSGILLKIIMKRLFANILDKTISPDFSPNKLSKDVLAHSVSSLIFNSTDNIILSVLTNLNVVTLYSNYNILLSQITNLTQKVLDGTTAIFGSKFAQNDKNSYRVFRQIWASTCFIASVVTTVFFVMVNSFVKLWVGNEYVLSVYSVVLFSLILYCGILLSALQTVRDAKGLYAESKWFTILQAVMNIVLTLILVPLLGINGALIGTVTARCCITIPFNYRIVDKLVFPNEKSKWLELIVNLLITIVITGTLNFIYSFISLEMGGHFVEFIVNAIFIFLITAIVYFIIYWIIEQDFRKLIYRVIHK